MVALLAATPAGAAGRLGVQLTAVGNSLVGELPAEGRWQGATSAGFGAVAELNLAPDVSLSFQPSYAPRQSRQEFKEGGVVVGHYDYELDHLSLPLLLRVSGDAPGARGFVTAGLTLNVLLDATIDTGTGTEDIADLYHRKSMGALFGAGVMVPLGGSLLTFELRYEQGLDDLVVREPTTSDSGLAGPSVKYRGISLSAGFLFSLGGG